MSVQTIFLMVASPAGGDQPVINLQTILTLVLGAGGAAFIQALVAGVRAIQRGVNGRTREGIADLARWRDEANDAREKAEKSRDGWRTYAAMLEYEILSKGGTIPENAIRPTE